MIKRVRACLECGEDHRLKGDFCTTACRNAFNNRRKARGAELYDLYMAHRFDRTRAQELRLFQAINRLASNWRREDHAERVSRRSWRRPEDVLDTRPYLRAVVASNRTWKSSRGMTA